MPAHSRQTILVRLCRFEKVLAEKEAGRAEFGMFVGVYHELMLVILCRLQSYELTVRRPRSRARFQPSRTHVPSHVAGV